MVLVDSSVWIDYFKGNPETLVLNTLIDYNALCVNDFILAELVPILQHQRQTKLKTLLELLPNISLDIDWKSIIEMQTLNLKHGINKVGVADIIIAQQAIANNLEIFSFDKHFKLMSSVHNFNLFSY